MNCMRVLGIVAITSSSFLGVLEAADTWLFPWMGPPAAAHAAPSSDAPDCGDAGPTRDQKALVPLAPEERREIVARSRVWLGPDPRTPANYVAEHRAGRSLADGPKADKKWKRFASDESFRCRFVEFDPNDVPGGKTPKFWCEFPTRDGVRIPMGGDTAESDIAWKDVKVKYDLDWTDDDHKRHIEANNGVWGEFLSTRLLWALGFPVDAIYPVRVTCENCPKRPWAYLALKRKALQLAEIGETLTEAEASDLRRLAADRVAALPVQKAVVESKFSGKAIERCENQGWDWNKDLNTTPEQGAGTLSAADTRIEREGLALLTAFIQHADNKAEQQRLICRDDPSPSAASECQSPMMLVQDLGFSFGAGALFSGGVDATGRPIATPEDRERGTADLLGFRNAPIWKDPAICTTVIRSWVTGVSVSKRISEDARVFVVSLLATLTDDDLTGLFQAARFDRRYKIDAATTEQLIDDWVQAFRNKREALAGHTCQP